MNVDELIAHLSALPEAVREMEIECPVWCSCYGHEPLSHIGLNEHYDCGSEDHSVLLLNPSGTAEPLDNPDLNRLFREEVNRRRGRYRSFLQSVLASVDGSKLP